MLVFVSVDWKVGPKGSFVRTAAEDSGGVRSCRVTTGMFTSFLGSKDGDPNKKW